MPDKAGLERQREIHCLAAEFRWSPDRIPIEHHKPGTGLLPNHVRPECNGLGGCNLMTVTRKPQ